MSLSELIGCQALPNLSVHTDPEEVFERTDIDAVVIATITSTHAPLALKAMEKGLVGSFEFGESPDCAER